MAYQSVFKRYELKYLLAKGQKEKVPEAMVPYMERDKYGGTTIGISYAGPMLIRWHTYVDSC